MRPSFFHHLHPPSIPASQARFRYTLGAVGLAVFLVLILGITGILEVFYYIPTPEQAAPSIQTLTFLVPFGGLVRNLHYWAAQFLGGVAGAGLVKILWGGWAASVNAGVTMPEPGISPAGAAGIEFLITGSLLCVILYFVSHPRLHRWTGFAAGIWVAFLVFAEAPVTGTSLNPARSLGPAVVTDTYRDLWVYFLGPMGGAAAVALLWRPAVAAGVRSVFCAKLFHTDRYACHLADCRFAERHPSGDGATRKEDLP